MGCDGKYSEDESDFDGSEDDSPGDSSQEYWNSSNLKTFSTDELDLEECDRDGTKTIGLAHLEGIEFDNSLLLESAVSSRDD